MENDLELESVLFEEEENQNVFSEQIHLEKDDSLSERWASWVNIVNR